MMRVIVLLVLTCSGCATTFEVGASTVIKGNDTLEPTMVHVAYRWSK